LSHRSDIVLGADILFGTRGHLCDLVRMMQYPFNLSGDGISVTDAGESPATVSKHFLDAARASSKDWDA
jgi:hypothetical protein